MIEGLESGGHTTTVIVPMESPISNELKIRGITFIVIPFYNEVGRGISGFIKGILKFLINWKLVYQFSKDIKNFKFDIIHSNSSVTFFGAYISYVLGIPHIWHVREFLSEFYQIKYCFGERYFKYWLNRASGCICISKYIYLSRLEGITNPIKKVIYNGIVLEYEVVKTNFLKPMIPSFDDEFIIGIIGSIVEGKNQLEAVKAFNSLKYKYPKLKLHIIGDGEISYIDEIKKFIVKNNLETRIQFEGLVYRIMDYYCNLDLLLMCSKSEGLGRVTVEAMAKGVPVIGFNSGGTPEIISDGFNGLLYNGDYLDLSDKISKVYLNHQLRNDLSKRALSTVKDKFLIENYSDQLVDFYREILSN